MCCVVDGFSTSSAIFSACCIMSLSILRLWLLRAGLDVLVYLVIGFIIFVLSLELVPFGMIRRATILGQILAVIVILGVTLRINFVGSGLFLFSVSISSAIVFLFGVFVLACLTVGFIVAAFVSWWRRVALTVKSFVSPFCLCLCCDRLYFLLFACFFFFSAQ